MEINDNPLPENEEINAENGAPAKPPRPAAKRKRGRPTGRKPVRDSDGDAAAAAKARAADLQTAATAAVNFVEKICTYTGGDDWIMDDEEKKGLIDATSGYFAAGGYLPTISPGATLILCAGFYGARRFEKPTTRQRFGGFFAGIWRGATRFISRRKITPPTEKPAAPPENDGEK